MYDINDVVRYNFTNLATYMRLKSVVILKYDASGNYTYIYFTILLSLRLMVSSDPKLSSMIVYMPLN
jgi:hypothetical protein